MEESGGYFTNFVSLLAPRAYASPLFPAVMSKKRQEKPTSRWMWVKVGWVSSGFQKRSRSSQRRSWLNMKRCHHDAWPEHAELFFAFRIFPPEGRWSA